MSVPPQVPHRQVESDYYWIVAGLVAKAFAYLVVGLRFPLILGWAAAVVAAVLFLPPLPSSGGLSSLIPAGSPAAHADADAVRPFGYPLEPGVAIVQRDPRGLPPSVVDKTARTALAYDRSASIPGLLAVIPVPNGAGISPAIAASPIDAAGLLAGVRQTTSTIVTYLEFRADASLQQQVPDAREYAGRYLTHVVGVTGPVAAQYEQGLIINRDLGWVELFTVLAIALIVGVRFRSALAPLAVLACAGTAYVLVVARGGLLRAFGPGLAATVLVSVVVSLTLMPALLAVFGGLMFRGVTRGRPPGSVSRLARFATSKPVALLVIAGCVAGLGVGASYARGLGLGSPLIGEMPPSSDVARAGAAAAAGFAPGILAPTEVLVMGPGAGSQTTAANRLEDALRRQPGVASVVGPSVLPVSSPNPMIARDGTAVRFALVYDTDPLNATAIGQVRVLTARLPALARAAGLRGVRYEVGGQTALTGDAINATASDLWRVGLAIMLVTLLLLLLFLRAVLAPVYLLAASLLAVLGTLGLTVLICDAVFGSPDLVYFVPFAAGVLLVSLGSDYNDVFSARVNPAFLA